MKWIGLTGGIACGKSTVAELLRKNGVPVVDADQIVHDLLLPTGEAYHKVLSVFGPDLMETDQTINRRKLGARVFGKADELLKLETILHPSVRALVQQKRAEFEAQGCKVAVYDVPLLFEKKLAHEFDATVCVSSDEAIQKQRMRARNQWSEEEINHRLQAQMPVVEKCKNATYTIENNGTLEGLERATVDVLKKLTR